MLNAALESLLSSDSGEVGDHLLFGPGASRLVEVLFASDGSGRVALNELDKRMQSMEGTSSAAK
eukprot:10820023-Prorocentrum_lima.AAC.1